MISIISHSMITTDEKNCVIIHRINYFLNNHLAIIQFSLDLRVTRMKSMSCMIHPYDMPYQHGKIILLYFLLEIPSYRFVESV